MRPRTVREIQARSRSIRADREAEFVAIALEGAAEVRELAGHLRRVNAVFRERRERSTGAVRTLAFWARVREWQQQDRRNCR